MDFPPLSSSDTNKLTIEAYSDPDCRKKLNRSSNKWVSDFKPKIHLKEATFKRKSTRGLLQAQDPRHAPVLIPQPLEFTCEVSIMRPFSSTAMLSKFTNPFSSSDSDYVTEKLDDFENVYKFDSDNHRYPYLLVKSGSFLRKAILIERQVKDTVYNKDNSYKSLALHITFQEVASESLINNDLNMNSPDMTHHYKIKEGDTLMKISKEIYGTINYHLELAKFNNLTNIRMLKSGATIIIPPLK